MSYWTADQISWWLFAPLTMYEPVVSAKMFYKEVFRKQKNRFTKTVDRKNNR